MKSVGRPQSLLFDFGDLSGKNGTLSHEGGLHVVRRLGSLRELVNRCNCWGWFNVRVISQQKYWI
jgi:hypothetical protein